MHEGGLQRGKADGENVMLEEKGGDGEGVGEREEIDQQRVTPSPPNGCVPWRPSRTYINRLLSISVFASGVQIPSKKY